MRRRIREADQVIVICGKHTEESMRVSAELLIAQEEKDTLLPALGPAGDHVHETDWGQAGGGDVQLDRQILHDQIALKFRKARHRRCDRDRSRRGSESLIEPFW